MCYLSDSPYSAEVGGGGVALSGGLQHCVGLMRALVRDPQVIVLDETTSKVDTVVWHAVSGTSYTVYKLWT